MKKNRKKYKCESPGCEESVVVTTTNIPKHKYCKKCKKTHPAKVLKIQTMWGEPIKDVIVNVSTYCNFDTCQNVATAIGMPRFELMKILKRYFGFDSWEEFKKEHYHKCKNKLCVEVEYKDLFPNTDNRYYITRKLQNNFGICSCLLRKNSNPNPTILLCVKNINNIGEIHKKISKKQKKVDRKRNCDSVIKKQGEKHMEIDKNQLIKELRLAKECLSKQDYAPIFNHYSFLSGKMIASDGALSVKQDTVLSKMSCAVPGLFLGVLNSLPTNTVKIVQKEDHLKLKYGKNRMKIATLPEKDIIDPFPDKINSTNKIEVDEHLLNGMEYCFVSANTDMDNNSDIFGLVLKQEEGNLFIHSSDRKRVSEYKTSTKSKKSFNCLLPLKFCKFLTKNKLQGTLFLDNDFVLLNSDNIQVHAALSDEIPMDIQNKILSQIDYEKIKFCENPKELLNILERCEALGSQSIQMETVDDKIVVTAKNEFGEIYEELEVEDFYMEEKISFEVGKLIQALDTNEKIGFSKLSNMDVIVGQTENCLHVLASHQEYNK